MGSRIQALAAQGRKKNASLLVPAQVSPLRIVTTPYLPSQGIRRVTKPPCFVRAAGKKEQVKGEEEEVEEGAFKDAKNQRGTERMLPEAAGKGSVVAPPSREAVGEVTETVDGSQGAAWCTEGGSAEQSCLGNLLGGKIGRGLVFRIWKLPQVSKVSKRREEKFELSGETGGNDG